MFTYTLHGYTTSHPAEATWTPYHRHSDYTHRHTIDQHSLSWTCQTRIFALTGCMCQRIADSMRQKYCQGQCYCWMKEVLFLVRNHLNWECPGWRLVMGEFNTVFSYQNKFILWYCKYPENQFRNCLSIRLHYNVKFTLKQPMKVFNHIDAKII